MYLKRPEIAGIVVDVLHRGVADEIYELGAFVVMANHVHVLLLPPGNVSGTLQWIKGVTARECNLAAGYTWSSAPERELKFAPAR